ncbi:GNAT family N-acetyltransferase [bacterium]|nr:GNAT family N-acetyltransferase [candidate division CSSED10-310 bacterium]
MAESYGFNFIDFSQIHSLSSLHPLILRKGNSMHNPIEFISDLKASPDISTDFPFFFYVFKKEKIVASVQTFPDLLFGEKEKYKWAWTADLLTDPNYRGQGAATCVWKNMVKILFEHDVFVGGAFANPITTHICRKMGFTITNTAHRLLFLKSSMAFLSAHVKYKPISSLVDAIYRGSIYVLRRTILRTASLTKSGYEIRKLDYCSFPEYNGFNKLCYGDRYHFDNSKDRIRWKLKSSKNLSFYVILEEARKNPVLYLILKDRIVNNFAGRYSNFRLMTLMDFGFYSEGEKHLKTLLLVLEKLFWESSADVLEIVTSDPDVIRLAYRSGFVKAGRGVEFWFKAPRDRKLSVKCERIENWHFTHFVSDAYSFQ